MENDQDIRCFARIGFLDTFMCIAIESYNDYVNNSRELSLIMAEGGETFEGHFIYNRMTDYMKYDQKVLHGKITVITFLITYLEAFIYDLGAIVLGDSYIEKYLDKLNLESKWIIIPKLITGKELDKSRSYWGDFRELIKWRNNLIHHKTTDAFSYRDNYPNVSSKYELTYDVSKGFKMIKELFYNLDEIDPKGFHLSRINHYLEKLR